MRAFTLIALAPAAVSAFAPKPAAPRAVALKATVEETIEVESIVEDVDVKDELLSVVGAAVGDSVSSDLRDEVSELLVKMESKNPTAEPATSALLNGVWDVAYQGYAPGPLPSPTRPLALALYAGGFTPGVAGLSAARMLPDALADVGSLEIAISRGPVRKSTSASGRPGGIIYYSGRLDDAWRPRTRRLRLTHPSV